jgi:hypothetical protein
VANFCLKKVAYSVLIEAILSKKAKEDRRKGDSKVA